MVFWSTFATGIVPRVAASLQIFTRDIVSVNFGGTCSLFRKDWSIAGQKMLPKSGISWTQSFRDGNLEHLFVFTAATRRGGNPLIWSQALPSCQTQENTFKIHFLPLFSLCCDVSLSHVGPRVSRVKLEHEYWCGPWLLGAAFPSVPAAYKYY